MCAPDKFLIDSLLLSVHTKKLNNYFNWISLKTSLFWICNYYARNVIKQVTYYNYACAVHIYEYINIFRKYEPYIRINSYNIQQNNIIVNQVCSYFIKNNNLFIVLVLQIGRRLTCSACVYVIRYSIVIKWYWPCVFSILARNVTFFSYSNFWCAK